MQHPARPYAGAACDPLYRGGPLAEDFDPYIGVNSLAINRGAFQLISASEDCTLRTWDLLTRRTLFLLEGHSEAVMSVTADFKAGQAVSISKD